MLSEKHNHEYDCYWSMGFSGRCREWFFWCFCIARDLKPEIMVGGCARRGQGSWIEQSVRCSIKSCVDLLWMWQALRILACSLLRISEHCSSNDMGRMQRMRPVVRRPQWMASAPMDEARTYGPEILGFQVLSARRLCLAGIMLISSDFRFHTRTFQYWAVSILSILQWPCAEAVVLCPCLASRKVVARTACCFDRVGIVGCTDATPRCWPRFAVAMWMCKFCTACRLFSCATCGWTLMRKQRMGIALAAQPLQDAQTGYTAATSAQRTRSFKKATWRWWVHTRGGWAMRIVREIVRGQVEGCNLHANHTSAAKWPSCAGCKWPFRMQMAFVCSI